MPFDGNGNHSLPPGTIVQEGQTVLPSQHNPPFLDVSSSLSQTLLRSGVAPWTGDQNANGNKLTNLAEPTNPNDAARLQDIPTGNGASEILYDESSFTLPTTTPLTLLDIIPEGFRSVEIQGEVTNLSIGTNATTLFVSVGDGSTWWESAGNLGSLASWNSDQSNSRPFWGHLHNLEATDLSMYFEIKSSSVVTPIDNSFFIRPSYTGYAGTYDTRPITSIRFSLVSGSSKNAAIRRLRIIGHR